MATNAEIQKRLNDLGAKPPLVVDGAMGPVTTAAVVAFQKSKGLAADGKVGPITLAALGLAFGTTTSSGNTAPIVVNPNNIHVRAKKALDGIGLTENESAFTRMVAWHETNDGQGWPQGAGAGSFNMGAITTNNPGPLDFQHKDSRNDTGQIIEYTTWFKGYPSFEAGMQGLANFLLKPNVKAALAKGDIRGATQAMYDNKYFLGIHPRNTPAGNAANVQDYYNAVTKAFSTIQLSTGEKLAIAGGIGLGTLSILGFLAWRLWRAKYGA